MRGEVRRRQGPLQVGFLVPRSVRDTALWIVALSSVVACLSATPATAAPSGAGTDTDEAPPAPSIDPGPAVDAGLGFLRSRIAGEPAALGFAYMLHRRFGLPDFGDGPARYDDALNAEAMKGSPKKGAMRLFRRMVDPTQEFREADIQDLSTDWDRTSVRALYCDQAPVPPDYGEQLIREAARGGYHLTHAAMALTWMDDNGCERPVGDATVAEWVDQLRALVVDSPPGDISFEAAGVLGYLGHADQIPEDYWPRLVDAQNSDGGWAFGNERPGSHWHPTLLALWAVFERFSSTKLDRSVPQADGPSPPAPPATAPKARTPPVSWTDMLATEERLLALTPDLHVLENALRNLELPGGKARALFAAEVRVADVDSPQSGASPADALQRAHKSFQPTTLASASRDTLTLWRPLFGEVAWFDHAGLHMVEGRFIGNDRRAFEATVSLDAHARLRDGASGWVRGLLSLVWTRGSDGTWQIAGFRTDRLDLIEAEHPFFREMLPEALSNDDLLRAARHSGHDEVVREFLGDEDAKGSDFFPPAMDEHPGLAVVDLDRDGHDDLYVMPHWGRNQLYRNRGDGSFEEIAGEIGLDVDGHTSAAIFADFDNDGDPDAILARTKKPSLYLRNDEGAFHDASELVEGGLPMLGSSVSAVDVDQDGLLDVYISTYAVRRLTKDFFSKTSTKETPLLGGFVSAEASSELRKRLETSAQVYDFPGPPNVLLKNIGEGRFRTVPDSDLAILANTYQATWADYDDDGDADVYLANDFAPNHLLRNEGDGRFEDVTTETGTSDVGFGMGATWGDVDGDTREDLYVSNMFSKAGRRITARFDEIDERAPKMARGNTLFRNDTPRFEDLSVTPGNRHGQKAGWSWGGQFVDVDNDSSLDLYVLSGYYTAPREFELPVDT